MNLKPGVINISVSPVQELIFPDLAAVSISLNAVVPTGIIRPPSDFVLAISAGVTMTIPASTFDSGDILSIIARGSSAQISAAIGGMIVAGNASATAVATIADNGVASLIFTSAAGCFVTGNVS